MMRKSDNRALQHSLNQAGLYEGMIDGILGQASLEAATKYLANHKNLLPEEYTNWPKTRFFTSTYQIILTKEGYDVGPIDGYFGPLTKNAATWFIRKLEGIEVIDFETLDPTDINPNNFPKETVAQLNATYGLAQPKNNCQAQIIKMPSPWKMRLDWNLSKTREHFWIHKDVAASLKRVLEAIFQHYGLDGIKKHGLDRFSGDYQCRNKRNGSTPSTHAWGIAIDFYGSKNRLAQSTNHSEPPTLAHPDLNFFWERWEDEGWYSLGRMEDRDWMHVQAAKGKRSKYFHQ